MLSYFACVLIIKLLNHILSVFMGHMNCIGKKSKLISGAFNLLFFPMQFMWPVNTDKMRFNTYIYIFLQHLSRYCLLKHKNVISLRFQMYKIVRHLEQPADG